MTLRRVDERRSPYDTSLLTVSQTAVSLISAISHGQYLGYYRS